MSAALVIRLKKGAWKDPNCARGGDFGPGPGAVAPGIRREAAAAAGQGAGDSGGRRALRALSALRIRK